MEPALRTFLDDLDEQDSTVKLKNPEASPVSNVRNDNSSGMLDLRAMAKRYQGLASAGEMAVEPEPEPLKGGVPEVVIAPIVDATDDSQSSARFLLALSAGALVLVLATVAVTAVITAKVVRRSVVAEMSAVQTSHERVQELPRVAKAATELPVLVVSESSAARELGAQAPISEVDPIASEPATEEAEPTLDFDESEVDVLSIREPRVERKPLSAKTSIAAPTASPSSEVAAVVETPVVDEVDIAASAPEAVDSPLIAESSDVSEKSQSTTCDEVLCLIEGKGCCGKTAAMKPTASAPKVDMSRPKDLSRRDIADGLSPITGRLNTCGLKAGLEGAVTIKLKISAEGKVLSSSANKGDEGFKSCVNGILKKAQFAKTQRGASLSYPVVLR